jgi:hypothetical protein
MKKTFLLIAAIIFMSFLSLTGCSKSPTIYNTYNYDTTITYAGNVTVLYNLKNYSNYKSETMVSIYDKDDTITWKVFNLPLDSTFFNCVTACNIVKTNFPYEDYKFNVDTSGLFIDLYVADHKIMKCCGEYYFKYDLDTLYFSFGFDVPTIIK